MISAAANLWISFSAGLFAPIAAVCVLPLYPGFLAYLSSQLPGQSSGNRIVLLGLAVTAGVISSMLVFGFIFTRLLQQSLTKAIGIVSPIAFGVLAVVSVLPIFNVDMGRIFPRINAPLTRNPVLTSFIFGSFFGAIVLPCNPASLVVLFAISTSAISFMANLLNFLSFGVGMAFPLLLFSIISAAKSHAIINFLARQKRAINLAAGLMMLAISLYYIIFVFRVFRGGIL